MGGKGGGGGGGGGKGGGSGGGKGGGGGGGSKGGGGGQSSKGGGGGGSFAGKSSGGGGGMMKAPGAEGYISRSGFESNPQGYFNGLHHGDKTFVVGYMVQENDLEVLERSNGRSGELIESSLSQARESHQEHSTLDALRILMQQGCIFKFAQAIFWTMGGKGGGGGGGGGKGGGGGGGGGGSKGGGGGQSSKGGGGGGSFAGKAQGVALRATLKVTSMASITARKVVATELSIESNQP
ncbi:probable H/ACA ribonucleoprotein complex subunit 1 [Zingiber officinale]|uniref:probable H/ACA ribonucleoprotein complex subunit 1 n=1 Tax=Zingiber officinale TaxID=94328 RepID=UPI001C4D251F|nr:probable H/ACA ribonucleoprotein complex subunit 1 [Zingiber officinale]